MKTWVLTLAIFVVITGITLSCDDGKKRESKSESAKKSKGSGKNGLVKILYGNGEPKVEIMYKNGKKDGLAREYYENGKVSQEINYREGIKQGSASFRFT